MIRSAGQAGPDRCADPVPPAEPRKPLLIYDGDCRFCRACVARGRRRTGDRVAYAPYQEVASRYPAISPEALDQAVHLVEPDGRVTRAAGAVFRALELGGHPFAARCYRGSRLLAWLAEAAYRQVAKRRGWFSRFLRAE